MNTRFNLRSLLVSAVASTLVLQASISFADDTEIFFGGSAVATGIQPNVLFVMDNSGSMSGARMTQLKAAFKTIISGAGNINVGVMSMNTTPRLLSPVQDINQPMNFKLASPEMLVSGDDATYRTGTTVPVTTASTTISDPNLIMGYVKNADAAGAVINTITRSLGTASTYDTDNASYYVMTSNGSDYVCSAKIVDAANVCTGAKTQINATSAASGNDGVMLFRALNIPASSTITSAKLYLTPANATAQPAFSVKIENTKTAAAFNSDTTFTDHNFGVSNLQTSVAGAALVGGEVVLDVTTAFTNLKAVAPALNPIADIAMRVRGTTATDYPYYIGTGAANAPRLVVTWTNSEDVTRTTGIRFQNVAIPKGATITSARIDFVPAASDDRPITYTVSAQNVGNAPEFTASQDFTARPKTSNTATWTPSEWRTQAPQVYVEGPIVTGLVQSVIDNNSDWCGNNSMAFFVTPAAGSGSRTAFSVDAGQDLQPVLNVNFTGGDTGCLNPVIKMAVYDPKDDAAQSAVGKSPNLTATSNAFTNLVLGSRYIKVPVVKNATVLDAQLIVTPNNTTAGTANVYFENVGNSLAYAATNNNLSARAMGTATTCSFSPTAAGVPLTCADPGLATQLQAVFARTDWADGNALSVLLKPTSSGTAFAARTREVSPESGMQLRIKLADGGLGKKGYTVREYTDGIVQALVANGGTPIVPTLWDAAKYFVQTPSKHVGADPSPITSSCQANYLVFLTDGEANGTTNEAKAGVNTLTGSPTNCTVDSTNDSERCARTLVGWMNKSDMAQYDGTNTIQTSTIGFNTSGNVQATNLLNKLAELGGGKAYQAENASDLTKAFDDIVQAALATNTTFVNTSAPVNSFNRADNLDQLYFALFKPSEFDRWAGNLKRYRLKTEGTVATIVDADDAAAIDANTGFFKSTARSFWNSTQDGADITKGGAAVKLPNPDDRKLYTFTGANPAGSATALEVLKSTNANITKAKLGDSSMDNTARVNLISYIRGGPDATGTASRFALGDPIHSSPRLVTYGCTAYSGSTCTAPDLTAVMGSNEGYIHGFDTDTGVEQFAYMPQELLPNIKQLRDNAKSSSVKPRLYGMDNTVTLWVNDVNGNGVIYGDPATGATTGLNTDEFVYAYATMGRGGRNIYALDITDRDNPKILWQILGGTTTGFENLGQTWSTPVRTKIKIGTTNTDVLIFGGGYDTNQDALNSSTSVYSDDSMGNSIYIVNAKTGALIWSAGKAVSGFTQSLPKMKYSIPSGVRVIDLQQNTNGVLVADADRLADQFFVGDMGGQVWRFYINNGAAAGATLVTPAGTSQDGVFASVGGTTTASARRFYNEPDVSLLNVNGSRSLAVSIGSGYRGHPLNEYIQDRFYSFRTATLFKTTSEATLTENSLYDATANLVQGGSDAQKTAAATAFARTTGGWYITLTNTGEKVLSRALTSGGVVYFNTYEPTTASAACSAAVGVNRSYSARLMDATPASVPINGVGKPADRSQSSNSGGISGDPQLFCSGNNCWVLPDPAVPPVLTETPPLGKTYWIDQSDLD